MYNKQNKSWSRDWLWKAIPHNMRITEVGVQWGINAKEIWDNCTPARLVLVDVWHNDEQFDHAVSLFHRPDTEKGSELLNVAFIKAKSVHAAEWAPDGDLVYIDAGHSYEDCYDDLLAWGPKHRYITGHDYKHYKNYGVIEAVDKYVADNGYYLITGFPCDSYIICKTQEDYEEFQSWLRT